jgi:hypothetical protein
MKRTIGFAIVLTLLLNSCMTFTDFQSAKTVGKGNLEVAPSLSATYTKDLRFATLGLNVDYGMTDRFDWRLSFAGSGIANLVSLAPKVSVIPDRFALTLPAGLFWVQSNLASEKVYVLQPTLLLTCPIKEGVDLTFAPKLIYLKNENRTWMKPVLASNVGLSIHHPGSNLTYRPELGCSFLYSTLDIHAGIAVAYTFRHK